MTAKVQRIEIGDHTLITAAQVHRRGDTFHVGGKVASSMQRREIYVSPDLWSATLITNSEIAPGEGYEFQFDAGAYRVYSATRSTGVWRTANGFETCEAKGIVDATLTKWVSFILALHNIPNAEHVRDVYRSGNVVIGLRSLFRVTAVSLHELEDGDYLIFLKDMVIDPERDVIHHEIEGLRFMIACDTTRSNHAFAIGGRGMLNVFCGDRCILSYASQGMNLEATMVQSKAGEQRCLEVRTDATLAPFSIETVMVVQALAFNFEVGKHENMLVTYRKEQVGEVAGVIFGQPVYGECFGIRYCTIMDDYANKTAYSIWASTWPDMNGVLLPGSLVDLDGTLHSFQGERVLEKIS